MHQNTGEIDHFNKHCRQAEKNGFLRQTLS
ncbi:hypothetical protein ACROYT_G018699 [Oculina patagonica]